MKNPNAKNPSAGIPRGFTLTELLVVILIIASLAALAFFGTQKIRDMASKATSIRNLSQLQIANMSYATDHNGVCVPLLRNDENGSAKRWFQNLDFLADLTGNPDVKQLESTPTPIPLEMLDPKVVRARKPLHDRIYTSYGMNHTGLPLGGTLGSTPNASSSHNINNMPDPSRSMAFATATDFRISYGSRYRWDFENPKDEKTGNGEIAYRHGNKVLVVYFDGHAGEMGKADFEAIDRAGGVSNVFWKAQP
jgi:prepilin-type N-terminal cleavage/methylation domain-containing protein